MDSDYRTRIYGSYVSTRRKSSGEPTLASLRPRIPFLNKILRQHLPADRGAQILDLGCGEGAFVHVARQVGYANVRGVDRSPEQVALARKLGITGLELGDASEILGNEAHDSLDCIVALDLIEHLHRDELFTLADKVYEVLLPGGRWIIHTTNAESPFGLRTLYGDLTHELAFTTQSLSQLLYACGFSEVKYYEDVPAIHGTKSLARWLLWKIFRSILRLYLAAETGNTGRDAIFTQNFLAIAVK